MASDATGTSASGGSSCKCPAPSGRNLVICLDGAVSSGWSSSNVLELCGRLPKTEKQLVYYGSNSTPEILPSWLIRLRQSPRTRGSMGRNLIVNVYRWLSQNYQTGDRIFLFGYSRGAYEVRVVADMINTVGLLFHHDHEQVSSAYELWLATALGTGSRSTPQQELQDKCAIFKQRLCHESVGLHFVGVWDTVPFRGLLRSRISLGGVKHICVFRQALALDETRDSLLPEYIQRGMDPSDASNVKEVWFVGSHDDIGGVDVTNSSREGGPAFRWMLLEARKAGVQLQNAPRSSSAAEPTTPRQSRVRSLSRDLSDKITDGTSMLQLQPSVGRQIQNGQNIHESVSRYVAAHPGYTPKARSTSTLDWASLPKDIIETDAES